MDELQSTVLEYVKNEYLDEDDDTDIDLDSPLISSGIVDSFLEKKYSISIPKEKATAEAFDSVRKICDLVTEVRG
jgi:acyl carrier protein